MMKEPETLQAYLSGWWAGATSDEVVYKSPYDALRFPTNFVMWHRGLGASLQSKAIFRSNLK